MSWNNNKTRNNESLEKSYILGLLENDYSVGTRRFNHDDCPAGVDTKRRLYVTIPASNHGLVVSYCHNCMETNSFPIEKTAGSWLSLSNKDTIQMSHSNFSVPKNLEKDYDEFHVLAKVWLNGVFVDKAKAICTKYGIGYDLDTGRVYLPLYDSEGELANFQLRALKGQQPKYLTAKHPEKEHVPLNSVGDRLVIVEDLLSAITLAELGYCAYPLQSSHISTDKLYELIKTYQPVEIITWLDNDNDIVNKSADEIAAKAALFTKQTVRRIQDYSDPKHYPNGQLLEILK